MAALGASATGCGSESHPLSAKPYDAAGQIAFNGPAGSKKADPDKPLEVTAQGRGSRITDVTARDSLGRYVAGELAADGSRWHTTKPLAAGAAYTVRVSTEDEDGAPGRKVLTFETRQAAEKARVDVTFGPGSGEYGVGIPITAKLSRPVKDKKARALIERSLQVRSEPATTGSWHWFEDDKLHYRPKDYWPTEAKIHVTSHLEGVKLGERLWGGEGKPLKLTTGSKLEAVVDAGAHHMTVYRNGEKIKSVPVTTGMPGWETRNGTKIVLDKSYVVRMTSSAIGAAEFYDKQVYYSTRLTDSGEYVHAAPWSAGSHGWANVSHGCVGMSTSNAAWFYGIVQPGDIVRTVNSYGEDMPTYGNGLGDWNMEWKDWREGSVVNAGLREGRSPHDEARLRPRV